MPEIKLSLNWGGHPRGAVVTVDDVTALELCDANIATLVGPAVEERYDDEPAVEQTDASETVELTDDDEPAVEQTDASETVELTDDDVTTVDSVLGDDNGLSADDGFGDDDYLEGDGDETPAEQ
jgi:hypothetical protein